MSRKLTKITLVLALIAIGTATVSTALFRDRYDDRYYDRYYDRDYDGRYYRHGGRVSGLVGDILGAPRETVVIHESDTATAKDAEIAQLKADKKKLKKQLNKKLVKPIEIEETDIEEIA